MSFKHLKFKPNLNSFLLLALLVTLIYSFSNSNTTQENEYMTITGEYNYKSQVFHISKVDTVLKSIAIVDPERTMLQKRYRSRGYDVKIKEITSLYDSYYILNLISKYEKQGWILKSHGFGVGETDESSDITACQYLMTRVKR